MKMPDSLVELIVLQIFFGAICSTDLWYLLIEGSQIHRLCGVDFFASPWVLYGVYHPHGDKALNLGFSCTNVAAFAFGGISSISCDERDLEASWCLTSFGESLRKEGSASLVTWVMSLLKTGSFTPLCAVQLQPGSEVQYNA